MLQQMKEKGIRSFVATSKPQVHAQAICEKFGIAPYVEKIAGPAVGGTEAKADIIQRILTYIGPAYQEQTVMVGDRKFDVIGARTAGLPVIAVGYGYGNDGERKAYPPDFFAPTVADLQQILLDA